MRLLIGTASWTDPTLLACGRFYPPEASDAAARLRFYAARFPVVEADSPYYGLPAPETTHAWAQRTPGGFVFDIKAFRLFTGHQTPLRALPADLLRDLGWQAEDPRPCFDNQLPAAWRDELWRRFLLALEPLRAAGKLGLVHCQFPPWVRNDARGAARLDECARRLEDLDASVEFRHESWLRDAPAASATLARLRERAWCIPWSMRRRAFPTPCRRSGRPPAKTWRWCACTGATARPGTTAATPPRRVSSMNTTKRNWPSWRGASSSCRRGRRM